MDNEQILLILTDLVKKVQKDRDIYVGLFISKDGVSINVYPNDGESEVK